MLLTKKNVRICGAGFHVHDAGEILNKKIFTSQLTFIVALKLRHMKKNTKLKLPVT